MAAIGGNGSRWGAVKRIGGVCSGSNSQPQLQPPIERQRILRQISGA